MAETTKVKQEETEEVKALLQRMYSIDEKLAPQVINFIYSHLDTPTLKGMINPSEYAVLLRKTNRGLLEILFITNYGEELAVRKTMHSAGFCLASLLYSRPLHGIDFELAKIEKSTPQVQHIKTG